MSATPQEADPRSWAEAVKRLPEDARQAFLRSLTPQQQLDLLYCWPFWARPTQLPPPGTWTGWLIRTGRGWGKTRVGAEFVRAEVEAGRARHIAFVNDTAADTRDIMVTGRSGILAVSHPNFMPVHVGRHVRWPNGAVATLFSAEAPEKLRGPEHDLVWADEPAKWRNLRKADEQGGTAWDNMLMGLRVGANPRWVATTTPRPIRFIRELVRDTSVAVTTGTSFENRANLPEKWFEQVIGKYAGRRLGRQEIEGLILEDTPGALWLVTWFDREGFREYAPPPFTKIVVAIDPSVTSAEGSDDAGIVVTARSADARGFVLQDATMPGRPAEWGKKAVDLYHLWQADCLVAEANNGGEMIVDLIHMIDPKVPVKIVWASRGKRTRAEPVSALYEACRVFHCGIFPELEDELCTWVPDSGMDSPNRMDALVWGFTELLVSAQKVPLRVR